MPDQSYTSNHRSTYWHGKVPVTGGVADVDYDIAFTYEYSAGDHTTPSYEDVNVNDVSIKKAMVYPGAGLRKPEVSHEKISQELDIMLGSGPLPDVDEWSNEPIPANDRQKKDAIDYFWKDIAESEKLRHLLFGTCWWATKGSAL